MAIPTAQLAVLYLVIPFYGSLIGFIAYCIYKYWQYRSHPVVIARHFRFVLVLSTAALCRIIFQSILIDLSVCRVIIWTELPYLFWFICLQFVEMASYLSQVMRGWHLVCDYRFCFESSQMRWVQFIDTRTQGTSLSINLYI